MSAYLDKDIDSRPAEHGGRPRRTLSQLQADGFGCQVLESDASGATVVLRRSMVDTVWKRVSGRGLTSLWEQQT